MFGRLGQGVGENIASKIWMRTAHLHSLISEKLWLIVFLGHTSFERSRPNRSNVNDYEKTFARAHVLIHPTADLRKSIDS